MLRENAERENQETRNRKKEKALHGYLRAEERPKISAIDYCTVAGKKRTATVGRNGPASPILPIIP